MIEPSLAAPDIRLSLDRDGVIRDAALAGAFAEETATAWIGLPWAATVPERDGLLLGRILGEVQARGLSPFRPLVQRLPSGREVAVEYTTFRQEGGQDLVAVGKSLQAVTEIQNRLIETQQAMAQDYLKLREIETRYRHLVNASSEAVLLLDEPIAKLRGRGIFPPPGEKKRGKSGYRQLKAGKMKRLATIHSDTQDEYYL